MCKSTSVMITTVTAILAAVTACGGARDVNYSLSRGISADIDASRETGSTAGMRGMTTEFEPYGAVPWQLGERHQSGQ